MADGADLHAMPPHGAARSAPPPEPGGSASWQADESISDRVSSFVDRAKSAAKAEVELNKARVAVVGDGAKRTSLFGFAAYQSVQLALTALVVGLVLWLYDTWGPVSLFLVAGVLLAAAAVFGLLARSAVKATSDALRASSEKSGVYGNE